MVQAMSKKQIIIRFSVLMREDVPEDWDEDMVEFWLNESSFCLETLVNRLKEEMDRNEKINPGTCNVCHRAEAHYVRDYERGDMDEYYWERE